MHSTIDVTAARAARTVLPLTVIAATPLALSLALALSATAVRADEMVAELERRLERHGTDAVNAQLLSHGGRAMSALNGKTASCELSAVSLSMRLARGRESRAVGAHGEALRAAGGACAGFVLAIAAPSEIPRYCASMATWGPAQTARELRRRIAAIDSDDALHASPRGQACRAAYWHELHHTRVVVRPLPRGSDAVSSYTAPRR